MATRVYLHVGLPKTGTSYIQQALWSSRADLIRAGVMVPGETRDFQRRAVWDLLGRRLRGADQRNVAGSWEALLDALRAWSGSAVLSEEFLVNATPRQARRIGRDLEPHELHIVVTVRELGQTIVSTWQGQISKGRTWTLEEYAAAVRDPGHGPPSAGVDFWLRHDPERVLSTWEPVVTPERVHLVVVPRPDSPAVRLLERFAAATGLDVDTLTPPPHKLNTTTGTAETELLRRLNEKVVGSVDEAQHYYAVSKVLKPALRRRVGTVPVCLPEVDRPWVADRANEQVAALDHRACHVVGDLDDLLPPSAGAFRDLDDVGEVEMIDVAVTALVAAISHLGPDRRGRKDVDGTDAEGGLVSASRVLAHRTKVAAIKRADRSRAFAWAARRYLRRTSG